jgi:hypothetical protein
MAEWILTINIARQEEARVVRVSMEAKPPC